MVVVDPPRAGLSGKALRRIGRMEPSKIVYVSCNPTTLASNVKELQAEWGYRLERVRPVDMFPHTPHIESVALLVRDGSSPTSASDLPPDQVGVRDQESEREQR